MGLLHIYCGDGKGKTTAALGLAMRAAGAGMRVHIVQFLKGTDTAELHSISMIPNISIERCDRNYGFTCSMTEEDRQAVTDCHNRLLRHAKKKMDAGMVDMLILDEWNAAYGHGLMDAELADELVFDRTPQVEMVLTGRNPREKFVKAADYVSEIHAVKHPYMQGVPSRKGIEF